MKLKLALFFLINTDIDFQNHNISIFIWNLKFSDLIFKINELKQTKD